MNSIIARTLGTVHTHTHTHTLCLLKNNQKKIIYMINKEIMYCAKLQ